MVKNNKKTVVALAVVPKKKKITRKKTYYPMYPIETQYCTLKYAHQANYTITNLIPSVGRTWRLNSLIDPDTDVGVVLQPQYRDQLFGMFDKARVISATVILKCMTNTDTPVEILAGPQMNSALMANVQEFRMQKGTKTKFTSAGKPAYLKFDISIAKLLGQTKGHVLIDDQQEQTINIGPAISADFQVTFNNPYGVASLVTLMEIIIFYHVKFTDPKLVATS